MNLKTELVNLLPPKDTQCIVSFPRFNQSLLLLKSKSLTKLYGSSVGSLLETLCSRTYILNFIIFIYSTQPLVQI